jgi:starch synthase
VVLVRKGFFYALEAFQKLEHPNKEFVVIGSIFDEMKPLLSNFKTTNVSFLGIIPNQRLLEYYSSSNVFILPSIEEGLAMVQGEALACGCPIIATPNTGASDLFTDGKEGFIVPLRSVQALTDKLQLLADNPNMRDEMSENGLNLVKSLNGWDKYGDLMGEFIKKII